MPLTRQRTPSQNRPIHTFLLERPQPGCGYPVNYSWIFENEEVNGCSRNDGDRARREHGEPYWLCIHPARMPRCHRKGVAEFGLHKRGGGCALGHGAKR